MAKTKTQKKGKADDDREVSRLRELASQVAGIETVLHMIYECEAKDCDWNDALLIVINAAGNAYVDLDNLADEIEAARAAVTATQRPFEASRMNAATA